MEIGKIGMLAVLAAILGLAIYPVLGHFTTAASTERVVNTENQPQPVLQCHDDDNSENNTSNTGYIFITHKHLLINATTWPIDNIQCSTSCTELEYQVDSHFIVDQEVFLYIETNMSLKIENQSFFIVRNLGDSVYQLRFEVNTSSSYSISLIKDLWLTVKHMGTSSTIHVVSAGTIITSNFDVLLESHSQAEVSVTLIVYYRPYEYSAGITFDELLQEV